MSKRRSFSIYLSFIVRRGWLNTHFTIICFIIIFICFYPVARMVLWDNTSISLCSVWMRPSRKKKKIVSALVLAFVRSTKQTRSSLTLRIFSLSCFWRLAANTFGQENYFPFCRGVKFQYRSKLLQDCSNSLVLRSPVTAHEKSSSVSASFLCHGCLLWMAKDMLNANTCSSIGRCSWTVTQVSKN